MYSPASAHRSPAVEQLVDHRLGAELVGRHRQHATMIAPGVTRGRSVQPEMLRQATSMSLVDVTPIPAIRDSRDGQLLLATITLEPNDGPPGPCGSNVERTTTSGVSTAS